METAQRAQSRRQDGHSRPDAVGEQRQTGIPAPAQSDGIHVTGQAATEASPRWRVSSPAR